MVTRPRRDSEGHQQGHQHGDGDIEGHWTHVRTHHAGDEIQRQKGDDDSEGGEDGRRTHFIHGGKGGLQRWLLP